jgi:two-component system nitrogen regulation sensor histidine kinase NtrY
MSIRSRLVVMCVVVAILPAIPLSLLVQSLIEKSFDLGLSPTVEEALQSGIGISQTHLSMLHAEFEEDVARAIGDIDTTESGAVSGPGLDLLDRIAGLETNGASKAAATTAPSRRGIDGIAAASRVSAIAGGAALVERPAGPAHPADLVFYDTGDRSIQLAVWGGKNGVVFYKKTDPEFLREAGRVIEGRQIFAQLRLAKPSLKRSFFYPFVIIYALILALALSIALLIAERLSDPLRRLAAGADTVAEGDWSYRLDVRSAGEIGRLVDAFNGMVSRLDAQRRRIVDMERIATWREMARHLAHEIKNPLLPIRLTVQELRDQYKGDDPHYRGVVGESVRVIEDELDHLQNLVKEFSSFARMPDLAPRVESLAPLVGDVAMLYPQIDIRVDTDPALEPFVFDPDQIRRVIVNLLDNAQAVLSGAEHPEVRIALRREADDAVIEVSDNGPGIADEDLARVFEPYFTTREEGSGLGLAIVKNIVLLHGGTIEARASRVFPRGAAFVIRLPLAGPESERE